MARSCLTTPCRFVTRRGQEKRDRLRETREKRKEPSERENATERGEGKYTEGETRERQKKCGDESYRERQTAGNRDSSGRDTKRPDISGDKATLCVGTRSGHHRQPLRSGAGSVIRRGRLLLPALPRSHRGSCYG